MANPLIEGEDVGASSAIVLLEAESTLNNQATEGRNGRVQRTLPLCSCWFQFSTNVRKQCCHDNCDGSSKTDYAEQGDCYVALPDMESEQIWIRITRYPMCGRVGC